MSISDPKSASAKGGFGVFPEGDGWRLVVFAEEIEAITVSLDGIDYPLEPAPLKPNTYTRLFPHLKAPFTYVYNIFKNNNFYANLLDPFCQFTDESGTKSVHRDSDPFTFKTKRPHHPAEKTILYEICTRGFTNHPSSKVKNPGTFEGVIEKLPFLKTLGITAIELMPVTLFTPYRIWGYMPRSTMALAPHLSSDHNPTLGLKKLVDAAHCQGIEVIVDLVFNHTDTMENTLFPFSDNIYLKNFDATGCGNTLNVNHPWLKSLLIRSCELFVEEYQIDGIRFDLGLALCRDANGVIQSTPPFIHDFENRYKNKIKIFYEPWDASGYQIENFPSKNGCLWDDRIRDTIRRFARMEEGQVPALHDLINSPNSVKMVTCHDGFSLLDLVSYNEKHNWANGYKNRDGHDSNFSSNCGVEGETSDSTIIQERLERMQIILTLLFCFSGPILLKSGDEQANTQHGNNNPFNQDNQINYVHWNSPHREEMLDFTKKLIQIYLNTPLSNPHALIKFHGKDPDQVNFSSIDHLFALSKTDRTSSIFVAINTWTDPIQITPPENDAPHSSWTVLLTNASDPLLLSQNNFAILEKKFDTALDM